MLRARRRPPHQATVVQAVRYLASVCDGAVNRDGLGFRSDHVVYGHWLAQLPLNEWGPDEYRHGETIMRVYRDQLRRARLI